LGGRGYLAVLLEQRIRLDGGLEVVDLDGEVAEASADVHRAVGWPMHEFEGIETRRRRT